MNKGILIACASLLSVSAINFAYADADDAKWVAQCISDNQSEGQSVETLTKYCTCMNEKMSASETMSITEWEKTHTKENEECSKSANWMTK